MITLGVWLILIITYRKWNHNLLSNLHLSAIIQPSQSIWFSMFNSTQIQFPTKGNANHISTTSTINNQTIHLILT
jgi:hypothetical protein